MSKELDRLDRLAAEKVMGWLWVPDAINYQGGAWRTTNWHYRESWQPTRRIEQAWECLEKLGSKWWKVEYVDISDSPTPNYSCLILINPYLNIIEFADTAAEAIVRACLKAKGIEV